jgi:hypothetical protein
LTRDQPDDPARKLLTIGEELAGSLGEYETNPSPYEAHRGKIAEAIEAIVARRDAGSQSGYLRNKQQP